MEVIPLPEIRNSQIMVNIEPTLYDIVVEVATKERTSASSYARALIIEDLLRRGLLTESILAQILTGRAG